ncbi:hypothetical protein ACIGCZ_37845 [Streptomyces nigra]|uniref:hypothetical protein n=1 Tax=Streptomyces nigra TaxID=1827580 RepID=UPI0037D13025
MTVTAGSHAEPSTPRPLVLDCSPVGHALVIHPEGQITEGTREMAQAVAQDPDHDLVLIDLPANCPIWVWELVARTLSSAKRGIRLVIGGRSRETAAMAGQWLSERLQRTVLAPDGTVTAGSAGSLFVHAGRDSGWVRFTPGEAPRWEAKRFPRPRWENTAAEQSWSTSPAAVAEQVPGGTWLRPVAATTELREHRALLTNTLLYHQDVLSVVLGCPGTARLAADDITRYWEGLPLAVRADVRFVLFGPLDIADDVPPGQALADLLREPITYSLGIPTDQPGGQGEPQRMYTTRRDGTLGWSPYVRELRYQPREHPGADPAEPVVTSYRQPVPEAVEISPRVFWYAPDAVLEVVRAGLWMRPPDEPANASAVRSMPLDPDRLSLVFDAGTESLRTRMGELAAEAATRIEPEARAWCELLPAPTTAAPAPLIVRRPAAGVQEPTSAPPAAGAPGVSARPSSDRVPVTGAALPAALRDPDGADGTDTPGGPADRALPVITGADSPSAPWAPPLDASAPTAHHAAATTAAPGPAPVPPAPIPAAAPPPPPEPRTQQPPEPPRSPQPRAEDTDKSTVHPAPLPPGTPAALRLESTPDLGPGDPAESDFTADPATEDEEEQPISQPDPAPEASAVVPAGGLDKERAWLRRTLNDQYDALANLVARLLSERPGMRSQDVGRPDGDVITDLVALRMYLADEGAALNDALHRASTGPHVPFARCAAAGLRRLPSHRGTCVLTTAVNSAQWRWYQEHPQFTDWGFLNALVEPLEGIPGDCDLLIWSVSARRTANLEPARSGLSDRVLFLPGTSYRILRIEEESAASGRRTICLRELTRAESAASSGRQDASTRTLDEVALKTLDGTAANWARETNSATASAPRLPEATIARFSNLPGLRRHR